MDQLFTFTDIQHIIAIKLCFFVFVIFGVYAIYKKINLKLFLFMFGLLSAISYFFLVQGTQLMFWGLQGDENFIAALYYAAAHHGFFVDFAYTHLPAFYPPLFFSLFSYIGKFFDWNGIQIAKFANLCVFLFFPVAFYYIQEFFWKHSDKDSPKNIAWFVSAMALLMFVDTDAIILKQYEFVSAALIVLWTLFLITSVHTKQMTKKHILAYGVTGGLLFMSFYFWFFFSALGIAAYNLFSKNMTGKKYLQLGFIAAIAILVSAPFWYPLATVYLTQGSENFQVGYTNINRLATHVPFVDLSWRGLLAMFGFGGILFFIKKTYNRTLLVLFAMPYLWQIIGLFTILFFASPLQESKGFMFWNAAVLALGLGYVVEKGWHALSSNLQYKHWLRPIVIIVLIITGTQAIFGTFADKKDVLAVRTRAHTFGPGIQDLYNFLESQNISDRLIVTSGLPVLHTLLPVNDFLYYNQHYSHPGAHFSERFYFLQDATQIQSAKALHQAFDSTPWGSVDMFVFYKGIDEGYPLYFHLDNFPYTIEEKTMLFQKDLFGNEYFEQVYENGHFIVFKLSEV